MIFNLQPLMVRNAVVKGDDEAIIYTSSLPVKK